VIDNFGHLLTAAPLVSGLLDGAPGVTALATSLRLRGERTMCLDGLRGEDGSELFLDRAREHDPAWATASKRPPGHARFHCLRPTRLVGWRLNRVPGSATRVRNVGSPILRARPAHIAGILQQPTWSLAEGWRAQAPAAPSDTGSAQSRPCIGEVGPDCVFG
jgi:hypothetical protein